MELRLVRISDLYLHEETVDRYIQKLGESLLREGVLLNPILVDKDYHVVLDGTHRVKCLERLGYKRIPAVLVDYLDERIRLRNWYRVLSGDIGIIWRVAKDFSFVETQYRSWYAREGVIDRIVLASNKGTLVYMGEGDIYDVYCLLKKFEEKLRVSGVGIEYIHEEEAVSLVEKGKTIIITPKLSKLDIIRNARAGRVFPPKTTRHIFPVRPLFIEVPLDLLGEPKFGVDSEAIMEKSLSRRLHIKMGGRITIDRFYEEDYLVVFI